MTTEIAAPTDVSDPALFGLIQRLADNKYWLGRRYAEWCTAAPILEAAVAAAAMSQDEIGHARSHYPLFRQFVGRDIEPEDIGDFHSLKALDQPFTGWVDFVATNYLVDTALTILYDSAQDSSYDDLRNRARRILGEERIHWLHGLGWVKRLANESRGTRDALDRALTRLWTETVMWFGNGMCAEVQELVERRIIADLPDALRRRFVDQVGPPMEAAGLATSTIVSELPWSAWDGERHRLK